MNININKDLKEYIENKVFPEYSKNELAHSVDHIKYVIGRSFKFASNLQNINYNIVYAVAAYHDIGHYIDPKKHEFISAKIASNDKYLKKFFSRKEMNTIKEAIEDHRASSGHEPRSIYGKIVSTADRNISVETCLKRSYLYLKEHRPELEESKIFEEAYKHVKAKFGTNGYAKFYFYDPEYENFLKNIRKLLENKKLFINAQRECTYDQKNNLVDLKYLK